MKNSTLVLVITATAVLAGTGGYYFHQSRESVTENPPKIRIADLSKIRWAKNSKLPQHKKRPVKNICANKIPEKVKVKYKNKVILESGTQELVNLPGSILIKSGRHTNERGLPVFSILPKNSKAEIVALIACNGATIHIDIDEIKKEPNKFVLVLNKRKAVKVIVRENGIYTRKAALKNVAVIKIL